MSKPVNEKLVTLETLKSVHDYAEQTYQKSADAVTVEVFNTRLQELDTKIEDNAPVIATRQEIADLLGITLS